MCDNKCNITQTLPMLCNFEMTHLERNKLLLKITYFLYFVAPVCLGEDKLDFYVCAGIVKSVNSEILIV